MIAQSKTPSALQDPKTALVFDIQRSSLHDGPGIRTTVFLKGCPLRCAWCHNPESQSFQPERMSGAKPGDPETRVGQSLSVNTLIATVRADREFYEASGGGLTISGGEPMASYAFTRSLLKAARSEGIHTCLDTSGAASAKRYEEIASLVDLFLWDIKLSDPIASVEYIGARTEHLWAGLRALGGQAQVILRCPMIPGLNDMPAHFDAIAQLAKEIPAVIAIHVIPYHRLGRSKRQRLGLSDGFTAESPAQQTVNHWLQTLQSRTAKPVTLG